MRGQDNTEDEAAKNARQGRESSANPAPGAPPARLLYDGECGFCHWSVRFVVERDRDRVFRYAPIGGPTFQETVGGRLQPPYPDTVMLLLADGNLLMRSDAAIAILRALGPPWTVWARLLGLIPRPLRDLGYRMVAAVRRWLTRRPESSCPLLPPAERALFDP